MEQEQLKRLYHATVIKESKEPYHFNKGVQLGTEVLAYNPMCGDKYKLQIEQDQGRIKEGYFHGFGCALSKASTSALLRAIEGKTPQEIIDFCQSFIAAINGGNECTFDQEELQVMVELNDLGSRSDCIKLSWEALLAHLEEKH
ncbi:MAG: iron-sulfur cluster assembly scaffold protein [Cytophagales bacterium]|nr:iron-sulfur cluster assembly scaffold protein [Cytophagales bacterium]